MSSPPWQELPNQMPDDATTYWVVQYRWMSTPTEAEWRLSTYEWYVLATGLAVPWYVFPWFRAA